MGIYTGVIDEVIDDTYKVKFSVPNIIESAIAHPIFPALTPYKGDEIFVVSPDSLVNSVFMYMRLSRPESLRLAANGAQIRIENGTIYLEGRNENPNEKFTTEPAILGDTLVDYFGKILDVITKAIYKTGTMDPASAGQLAVYKDMLEMAKSNTVKLQ